MTVLLLAFIIFLIWIVIMLLWRLYKYIYFKGENFLRLKAQVSDYVNECNEFNEHIKQLKERSFSINKTNYGQMTVINNNIGKYKYNRKALNNYQNRRQVYDCSSSVLKRATEQPFKYLCKYFNIETNEETLEYFESMLNDFLAIEKGESLLVAKKQQIIDSIEKSIPKLIMRFSKNRLDTELNFKPIDLSKAYYPQYTFRYISAGGNSGRQSSIVFNTQNLNEFIHYLAERVKFKNSVKGQRQLMTPKLREKIKQRDNYTCCNCGISTYDEPHLLLEIDHIIPISKGGMTEENNLQTLCWKCNRTKGTKQH